MLRWVRLLRIGRKDNNMALDGKTRELVAIGAAVAGNNIGSYYLNNDIKQAIIIYIYAGFIMFFYK